MAKFSMMEADNDLPDAPPLFVTAFDRKGGRLEALVERGVDEPGWLSEVSQVRVQAPGGRTWSGSLHAGGVSSIYDRLLDLLGGSAAAWASTLFGGVRSARSQTSLLDQAARGIDQVQLWTNEPGETPVSTGPLFTLHAGDRETSPGFSPFAVVRRADQSVVHVGNADQFYIDFLQSESGPEAVPRALVDTSLAGAFWGYTEHQIPAASRCAGERLLETIFQDGASNASAPWTMAAAHAVLTHRDLLPAYGLKVHELLQTAAAPKSDAAFLSALITMALLTTVKTDRETVRKEIRNAISLLAANPVTYGETLRWLDLKLLAIKDMARRELEDPTLEQNFSAITNWLRTAYAGGQITAYAGEAPVDESWHDALAEKKTLSP